GTLFWCLTGRSPFPADGNAAWDMGRRLAQPPPSVRNLRPEVAPELDAVVARMLATNPDERLATPRLVMRALLAFLQAETRNRPLLAARHRPANGSERRALEALPSAPLHQM